MESFLGGELLAVVTAQFDVLLVDDIELGGNGLGVGDALGVGALDEVLDVVGDFGGKFFYHLVILDVDDGDIGCHEGDFADLFLGEVLVLDFDDALTAQLGAGEEVSDKDFVIVFFEAEDMDDLIDNFGGDMVDDGAVLDSGDHHFFLVFHFL